jgi:hypothetical protein
MKYKNVGGDVMNEKSSGLVTGRVKPRINGEQCGDSKINEKECAVPLTHFSIERSVRAIAVVGIQKVTGSSGSLLRAGDHGIQLVGNYDPDCQQEHFVQMPVRHDLSKAPEYDACLLTELQATSVRHAELLDAIGSHRLMVPALLQPALTGTIRPRCTGTPGFPWRL